MTGLGRFLFFAGRATLHPVQHQLATYVASLYWVNGARVMLAALRPARLRKDGRVGASKMHAGRALRGLVAAGILRPVGGYRYELVEDASRWTCWRPGQYERTAAEWQSVVEPIGLQPEVRRLLLALGIWCALHPTDPVFDRWWRALEDLGARYDEGKVRWAVAEAVADPAVVYPAEPDQFEQLLYGLVQRNRRRNA